MMQDGLLLLNKPAGVTSHSVVQMIRNRLGLPKAGHLGTLDPLATGVFPVCLGKATRLTPFYMKTDKCYFTAVRFGYSTTTDDREGDQEGPYRKPKFTVDQLKRALESFRGDYDQRPPAYSAKKIHGQAAYRLARKGQKPALPIQRVRIHDISLAQYENDLATIFIHCSSGTYVRSLARELGIRLRSGAHVHELTRTKFGSFGLDQTCDPEAPDEQLQKFFTPVEEMLPDLPELTIEPALEKKISSGSAIPLDHSHPSEEWVRVFSKTKALLAYAKVDSREDPPRLQPKIVFA